MTFFSVHKSVINPDQRHCLFLPVRSGDHVCFVLYSPKALLREGETLARREHLSHGHLCRLHHCCPGEQEGTAMGGDTPDLSNC